jgi:hypothetical protein
MDLFRMHTHWMMTVSVRESHVGQMNDERLWFFRRFRSAYEKLLGIVYHHIFIRQG